MTAPHGLMFARIEVPDLDASIGWYTYHVGLTLERRGDSWAQMRADVAHHAIELVAASERTESLTTSVCFDVREPGGLDVVLVQTSVWRPPPALRGLELGGSRHCQESWFPTSITQKEVGS